MGEWLEYTVNVTTAGVYNIATRVASQSASGFNLNYFNITAASTVTVPNVVGQAQATAQSNITASGLTVGVISLSFSDTVAAGKVISQSPAAGTTVAVSSKVNYVKSLGKAK